MMNTMHMKRKDPLNNKVMISLEEASRMILEGEHLIVAADPQLLDQLPKGHWIGGTIPYFMTEEGGQFTKERILVNHLPPEAIGSEIKIYDSSDIGRVYRDAPQKGISVIILPASSPTHFEFALHVTQWEDFAAKPLIGWVSGTALGASLEEKPYVYSGEKGTPIADGAVVLHISLPAEKQADINTVNIFRQDEGDTLMFLEDGFSASHLFVNGTMRNFAAYIAERRVDMRFPLVADYFGSMINISFKAIDKEKGQVTFYAPVFKGVEYKLAAPIDDYVSLFAQNTPAEPIDSIFFSCNCILNYVHSRLENKRTGGITGPITFGEIAYQLLNQTLVYAVIHDVK